jgi:hypothetical protein
MCLQPATLAVVTVMMARTPHGCSGRPARSSRRPRPGWSSARRQARDDLDLDVGKGLLLRLGELAHIVMGEAISSLSFCGRLAAAASISSRVTLMLPVYLSNFSA